MTRQIKIVSNIKLVQERKDQSKYMNLFRRLGTIFSHRALWVSSSDDTLQILLALLRSSRNEYAFQILRRTNLLHLIGVQVQSIELPTESKYEYKLGLFASRGSKPLGLLIAWRLSLEDEKASLLMMY